MTSGRRLIITFAPLGFAVVGVLAAWHYAALDLTLSHYDARGHLIVARRIADSLTPGWRQFGALWLPLPHLLNAIPAQWMWNYQTGFSAVAINIVAMAFGLGALARLVARRSGSVTAGLAAASVVLLNPNVLYLQSTSMTEPLLFGLCWLALDAIDRTLDTPEFSAMLPAAGPWLALATLTRYEAWPVAGALVTLAALSRVGRDRVRLFTRLAVWPAGAAAAFLVMGRLSMGRWFADAEFFTPDNPAAHQPLLVLEQIGRGFIDLAGPGFVLGAALGVVVAGAQAWRRRSLRPLVPLALAAAALLPFVAFLSGHPFRIRYMVPLIAASGAFVGVVIAAVPSRWRAAVAILALAGAAWSRPPLDLQSPMVREAQRERPAQLARAPITAALAATYDGLPILASMGSLGHYMQETSRIGLPLRAYLHEGNGDLWASALRAPRKHAGWILIETSAEGGDMLDGMARRDAQFLHGFAPVAEGGGATLYKRQLAN